MGMVTVGGVLVDERIAGEARQILDRYPVRFTSGYRSPERNRRVGGAAGSDHLSGFALDIEPDPERGGTWADVDRLARRAEPRQNNPSDPFRWVGYIGDPGHGRGDHLHLSWDPAKIGSGGMTREEAERAYEQLPRVGVTTITNAAEDTAKAVLGVFWDAFGEEGAKILLTVALVAGGVTLAGIGVARMFGLGEKAEQAIGLAAAAKGVKG